MNSAMPSASPGVGPWLSALGEDWTARARSSVAILLFAASLWNILISPFDETQLRCLFLGVTLSYSFVFLTQPKQREPLWRQAARCIAAIISLSACAYIGLGFEDIFSRAGANTRLDYFVAAALILLVLEGTRRTAGVALPLLSIAFLLYPLWYGPLLEGLLRTGSFSLKRVLTLQSLSTEGVIGPALQVTIEYVYLFVIYGAFLSRIGAIEFMDQLAKALCGGMRGGSAKITTISSLFMGLASGSAVANVVSQGIFTIPMMRREGYPPKTAAAIEASASTGGQIMPPVMGAAAFLMVEYTRIPYSTIILHALLPGLMFYLAIWFAVHWQGIKLGMQGLPKDQLPAWRKVMHEGGLHFTSLLVIVVLMSLNYAMATTVLIAIAVSLGCALVQKSSRHLVTVKNLVGAISDGFRDSVALLTSAACAGIIIGVVTQTSFGLKISTLVIDASMGYLWLALILCGIVCLILGMGLPTQIVYLTLAVLVAPTIVEMGVTMAGAHLFIIYFGMMSMVTPPVCFAAFAAAGIAGSKLMETGWEATRLSAAGIIVPFYFVYHPGILLIGDLLAIIEGVSRASLGLYAAGVALGMFVWRGRELTQPEFSTARIVSRVAAFVACILLCVPGMVTLAAGVMMAALSFAIATLTSPRVDRLAA